MDNYNTLYKYIIIQYTFIIHRYAVDLPIYIVIWLYVVQQRQSKPLKGITYW